MIAVAEQDRKRLEKAWATWFRGVRDPASGRLLGQAEAHTMYARLVGQDDVLRRLPQWWYKTLRIIAANPDTTLEPDELVAEAYIDVRKRFRRRWGRYEQQAMDTINATEGEVGRNLRGPESWKASVTADRQVRRAMLREQRYHTRHVPLEHEPAAKQTDPREVQEQIAQLKAEMNPRLYAVLELRSQGYTLEQCAPLVSKIKIKNAPDTRVTLTRERVRQLEADAHEQARHILSGVGPSKWKNKQRRKARAAYMRGFAYAVRAGRRV